jgi:HD-GYP domain-containing protein (c-di-GMP phosphodiesterase class II)
VLRVTVAERDAIQGARVESFEQPVRRVGVLSVHSSPLAPPGVGDSGGMNVTVRALAEAVDPELAADEQLRYGFLLHDVGKVGIPEAVLNKPGPLDADEWEVMRAHPLLGVQMVAGIKSLGSAVEVIRCHHERWDGRGYPTGLAGDAIPAGARVFSVADAFDAMTSDRPYRKAIPFDQACQEVADGAGSQFDPMVVDAFTAILPELPGLHAALHAGPVDSLAHSIP